MRRVLVKLKCWESVIKLLGGICGTAVQLSVQTVYSYGGYCYVWHGENMEIGRLILLVISFLIAELFIEMVLFSQFHAFSTESLKYSFSFFENISIGAIAISVTLHSLKSHI
jgi:hypothetical protein